MSVDRVTKRWIKNAADEQAVAGGCRFKEDRGEHVLTFARKYLRLYEGELAGQLLSPMPWQIDATMRIFGWEKWSAKWGRWVRRFRQASVWVPKKNGKSPTLAWWALYLLCADGEQGQKVYFGAKDGGQAREIAGKHAMEMVLASPDLSAECVINKTLLQITHEPTRSILKPISSSDARSQKSKEGLNGSVLIDETHVVDREFIGRVSRAGISRSEPLHIEVSTAGDDPESYGRERYDYGKQVEADGGNEQLLFVAYEAPQDLSDERLAQDPAHWGRLANPAWGLTIDPAEYLADYHQSRQSLTELARFKMYRLNIWQQSANPWLRAEDWGKCRQEFTAADMEGRPCCAGLDLSKTRDLTALVFAFPWEDGYRLLPYYFLPEQTANDLRDKVAYLEWANQGHITLTPGGSLDYGFVRKRFRELAEKFDVQEFAYDPWQAEQTTQEIEQGVVVEGVEIEQGTGVPRFEFRQCIQNYAGPCEDFEKLVIDGKLWHNGHPVLTWQAGNVTVKQDANGNKRPVKPPRGTLKTIDGIVGGIMGISRAMLQPGFVGGIELW